MTDEDRLAGIVRRLDRAMVELEEARPLMKELRRSPVLELALRLVKDPDGLPRLYDFAHRFEPAGVFQGGDWNRPADLEARLVSGSLRGAIVNVALESMSLLRFLAIAEEKIEHPDVSRDDARRFIEEVIAMNLDLLIPDVAEDAPPRTEHQPQEVRDGVQRLLALLMERAGIDEVLARLVGEAERVLAQRPIIVRRVARMIRTCERLLDDATDEDLRDRACALLHALDGPTAMAREAATPEAYAERVLALDDDAMRAELDSMGAAMRRTGLVSDRHATLIRALSDGPLDRIVRALALDAVGVQSLGCYEELCRAIVDAAFRPSTAQAVVGFAELLERGTLFFPPVARGLWHLLEIELHEEASEALRLDLAHGEDPRAALIAGTLQVLGQPLGVGQGNNPSCQSARAICLWAQNDPGYLLELVASAARDDVLALHFEGQPIESKGLPEGLIEQLHTELDPVSLLLVPHLDRIYVEMGRRTYDRGSDGHEWVNPELHGWWVHRGFATTIEYATGAVSGHADFVRLFYATYHPGYNGGYSVIYPQPAGIAGTDSHGRFLDWHAIAIQRVAIDPDGEMRVYFYNPNEDGGQRWGDASTSTEGYLEQPGESSLPFDRFVAHLYLFHYDPRERGDPAQVPADAVAAAGEIARQTWGQKLAWRD